MRIVRLVRIDLKTYGMSQKIETFKILPDKHPNNLKFCLLNCEICLKMNVSKKQGVLNI